MSKGFDNVSAVAFSAPPAFSAADIGALTAPVGKRTDVASAAPREINLSGNIYPGDQSAKAEIPAAIQKAIKDGKDVKFTAASDDPDYVLGADGKLVANTNPNHKPSKDGSLKIGVQNPDLQGKNLQDKGLIDAIKQNNANQKAAAEEMIRLFQQAPENKGKSAPDWMKQLASQQAPLPEIAANPLPQPNAPPAPEQQSGPGTQTAGGPGAAPENGFRQNCPPAGDPGGGFRGNGGFDDKGYFKGNGSEGDGRVWSGGRAQNGDTMGAGEQAKASDVYDYIKAHQFNNGTVLNDASCSGILGNMQTECHFKTGDVNTGEGAHGLCQWEGDRWSGIAGRHSREGLRDFADHFPAMLQDEAKFKSHLDSKLSDAQKSDIYKHVVDDVNHTLQGPNGRENLWTNKYVQMEFMFHELEHEEKGTLASLTKAQNDGTATPSNAAGIWQAQYERSADWNRQPRLDNAERIHHQIARGDFAKPAGNDRVASTDPPKKNTTTG